MNRKFTLAKLFVVVTAAAVLMRWPRLLMMATFVVPFFLARATAANRSRLSLVRYGVVAASIYLPATSGFFSDCSHCRKVWWEVFPIVPGVIPAVFASRVMGLGRPDDWIQFAAAGILVAAVLALMFRVGSRSKRHLAICMLVGAICSGVCAGVFAMMLRA